MRRLGRRKEEKKVWGEKERCKWGRGNEEVGGRERNGVSRK